MNIIILIKLLSVSGAKGISKGADVCLPTYKQAVRRALQWAWQLNCMCTFVFAYSNWFDCPWIIQWMAALVLIIIMLARSQSGG